MTGLFWRFPVICLASLLYLPHACSQDIEESGIKDRDAGVRFCQALQSAVKAGEKGKIAEWVGRYPIEVQRGNRNILVADDTDFLRKFRQIFDADMKESLFSATACELPPYPNGTVKIAEGKIQIDQSGPDSETFIETISPPQDTDSLFSVNEVYEKGAAKFFKELQKAISSDDRQAVANMCRFPLSVNTGDKPRLIHNRAELMPEFPTVFTAEVKRAVLALPAPIHMGWRGFMTDRGELWIDSVPGTHVFRVETVNGGYPKTKKHSTGKAAAP
jgi:hypothetical protein